MAIKKKSKKSKSVKEKSEANGKLVDKVDSTYMVLTEFSPSLR